MAGPKYRIMSVVGARPQFIKAAILSKKLRDSFDEVLIHTGQHFDIGMSGIFFKELAIPEPDTNLNVNLGSHGEQTGRMLIELEKQMLKHEPDLVLVYGDTNSTLAGALVAAKLHIPLAHVEAGLRSFDKRMPEEINRILTDHCSDILFCPNRNTVDNLKSEGITKNVHIVGDVMYDTIQKFLELCGKKSDILGRLGLKSKEYLLATLHRPVNTDSKENLQSIFSAFSRSGETIVVPLHPRTKKYIKLHSLEEDVKEDNIALIDPVGYLDMLVLEDNAKKIITDSGGIQKEAYWLGVPCITLRDTSEWVETVDDGWNVLVGADKSKILDSIMNFNPSGKRRFVPEKGSQEKIIKILGEFLDR